MHTQKKMRNDILRWVLLVAILSSSMSHLAAQTPREASGDVVPTVTDLPDRKQHAVRKLKKQRKIRFKLAPRRFLSQRRLVR